MEYKTEVISDVPASKVKGMLDAFRDDPRYVHHHIVSEPDGELTVIVIFRL